MDMVSASCTVNKGDLPMKITWMRNNQSIYSNDGISISRTNQRISILSIESVRHHHAGQYVCIAENSGGSVNYTTSLWVNGTHASAVIRHKYELDQMIARSFHLSSHIDFMVHAIFCLSHWSPHINNINTLSCNLFFSRLIGFHILFK